MPKLSDLTKSLSLEDFEERQLLATFVNLKRIDSKIDEGKISGTELTQKLSKDRKAQFETVVKTLGYDPTGERPKKQRGRPRDASIPNPLPAVGTVLTSILGDQYEILAYLRRPCSAAELDPDMIVYRDGDGKFVVRSVVHLLCGTLSDKPLVTWPDDPRGYMPSQPIPVNKRRVLRKQDLKEDRLARDADWQQDIESRKSGRRY